MRLAGHPVPAPLLDRSFLVETFAALNLAFLSLDIYLAHSVNEFGHATEWIPLVYGLAGATALAGGIASGLRRGAPFAPGTGRMRWVGLTVGAVGIVVGIVGLVLHLQAQFFQAQTLRVLIYSAPFVAPLAFTGVGLLLLMNRMVPADTLAWGQWVVVMALAGFAGNFGLALADHAQNGFFHASEWIPVVAAAIAVGYLMVVVARPRDAPFLRLGAGVLALQAVVGALGFLLHLRPTLGGGEAPLWDRVVFGAPLFAPLLFANLALLAGLGLWDLRAKAGADEAVRTAGVGRNVKGGPLEPPSRVPGLRG
jgi:hypothetical protein